MPKFINPLQVLRFEGDILFIDEKNNDDIAILSGYGYFNCVKHIEVSSTYDHVSCDLVSIDHGFNSWGLLYDRLKTLGNQDAYSLAELIKEMKMCNLNNPPIQARNQESLNPDLRTFHTVEEDYCKEINNFLSQKKEAVYFIGKHNLIPEMWATKGLESLIFSNEFIKLVFGDIEKYVNSLVDHSLSTLDFVTVDSDEYFQYLQTSFLTRAGVKKPVKFKIKTYEGYSIKLFPKISLFSLKDINENVYKLTLYGEFEIPQYFKEILASSRQQKTHARLKKTYKEKKFENLRNVYFQNLISEKAVEKTKMTISEEELNDQDKKRCGYKMINEKEEYEKN